MFCAASDCNNPVVYNSGYCNAHYQRLRRNGKLDKIYNGDRHNHPFYHMWNERKNSNVLCKEWIDFWNFVKGIGERPEGCKLRRFDIQKPYGPDNFNWAKDTLYREGETKNQQAMRRRREKPEVYKSYELKKNFKITYEQYNKILKEQNFVCAICEEPEKVIHHISGILKSLAVDHCHKTGKIRGLLCQRCNRVLGKIKDRIDLLEKMKAYLNAG